MSSKGENKSDLTRDEARILSILAEKGLTSTKPVQSGDALAYEGLEELAKELPVEKIGEMLKTLLDKGYLKESDYNNILACPSCGSVNILTSYSCPHCQSRKIRKSKLVEHKLCGYIGNLDDFEEVDGYICPKCKSHIAKISSDQTGKKGVKTEVLRVIGSSFVCDTCGAKFEKPNIVHTCKQCESDFTGKKAKYTRMPVYEVVEKQAPGTPKMIATKETKTKETPIKTKRSRSRVFSFVKRPQKSINPVIETKSTPKPIGEEKSPKSNDEAESPLKPSGMVKAPPISTAEALKGIESEFKNIGFTFEYGYKLRGKSGFEQSFDAVAKRGELTVLIDVSKTGEQADLIGLVGKKKDVDVGSIILLDITGKPYLVSLGKQYAITVLDGRSKDYSESIAEILGDKGGN